MREDEINAFWSPLLKKTVSISSASLLFILANSNSYCPSAGDLKPLTITLASIDFAKSIVSPEYCLTSILLKLFKTSLTISSLLSIGNKGFFSGLCATATTRSPKSVDALLIISK